MIPGVWRPAAPHHGYLLSPGQGRKREERNGCTSFRKDITIYLMLISEVSWLPMSQSPGRSTQRSPLNSLSLCFVEAAPLHWRLWGLGAGGLLVPSLIVHRRSGCAYSRKQRQHQPRPSEALVHFTQTVNGRKPSNWSLPWISMVVQWLGFCASNEGTMGSIPW